MTLGWREERNIFYVVNERNHFNAWNNDDLVWGQSLMSQQGRDVNLPLVYHSRESKIIWPNSSIACNEFILFICIYFIFTDQNIYIYNCAWIYSLQSVQLQITWSYSVAFSRSKHLKKVKHDCCEKYCWKEALKIFFPLFFVICKPKN